MKTIKMLWIKWKVNLLKSYFEMDGILKKKEEKNSKKIITGNSYKIDKLRKLRRKNK